MAGLAIPALIALAAIGWTMLFIAGRKLRRENAARRSAEQQAEAGRTVLEKHLAQEDGGRLLWRQGTPPGLDERARAELKIGDEITSLAEFAGAFVEAAALSQALNALDVTGKPFRLLATMTATGRKLRLTGADIDGWRQVRLEDLTEDLTPLLRLVEQASLLERGMSALPFPAWARDQTLTIRRCNTAFAELMDSTPEAVVAGGLEISPVAQSLARRAQRLGQSQAESQQLVVKGQRRLYDLTEVPLPGGGMAGFAIDQTALEDGHAELVRHIGAHDEVLEALGTGIVIFGPDRRMKFYNTAYREQFGLDEAFLDSRPTMDEVLEAKRERRQIAEQADFRSFKQNFVRQIMTVIAPLEELMHTPGGATFRMVASPHPLGGVILTFEDVTDKLTLERNYNTLIAVQKETLDHLYEGIAVFGTDGRLKLSNPAYAEIWHLDPSELEGEPHVSKIVDRIKPLFPARVDWTEARQRIVADVARRSQRATRLERGDGKIIDIAAIPLPDGGKLYKYADVTDTIGMERALRERNDALIAADRLKSEFIANVSYEFRTPLNVIIGYAELLIRQNAGQLNPAQLDYASSVLDSAQSLLLMVGDVIDVAAIEAGYIQLDIGELRLQPVLESVLRLYQPRARGRAISLALGALPADLSVTADEQRLKQALANLISNAVGSGSLGSRVEVLAEERGDWLVIAMTQTVPSEAPGARRPDGAKQGIRPADRRAGAGQALGRGTAHGLGMALVKTLIELHGGRVEVSIGDGIRRIECLLPRGESALAAAQIAASAETARADQIVVSA